MSECNQEKLYKLIFKIDNSGFEFTAEIIAGNILQAKETLTSISLNQISIIETFSINGY